MVLYTCRQHRRGGSVPGVLGHPCGWAAKALDDAGFEYELRMVRGYRRLPWTRRGGVRDEIRRLSGQEDVPLLVPDDGRVIAGSREIMAWARERGRQPRTERPERPAGARSSA